MFSLDDWGNELIEAYSHGMKQRLIMAAALLHDPEVIIVDEPMVGLDPIGIKLVKDLFRRLSQEGCHRIPVHPHPAGSRRPLPPHRHHQQRPAGDHRIAGTA